MYCDIYQPDHYLGLPVNSNYPMIESYLHGIHSVLKNACNQHSRTFVFQVVLKFPQAGGTFPNDAISRFIKSFKAKVSADQCRRIREGKRVHSTSIRYVWCREISSSLNVHYHVYFLMNADAYWQLGDFGANAQGHLSQMLVSAWGSAIGISNARGLVHFGQGARKLNVNDITGEVVPHFNGSEYDTFEDIFYWMSYLAKTDTKQFGDGGRNFGCSIN
ncbi:TPA: inovirus Gp2 family protein [Vibrio parahaemolyticus]|uniref:Inovirus Gp2 family protein n=1 Tax=Vibrio harveyi TaxID=669 RepID=A0ABN4KZ77_VIBHA|nr:inovirus Gp2 family protein [Vibrio harveyi]AMF98495.1 inovirus Gp2 family protein [Vibrio harveyi]